MPQRRKIARESAPAHRRVICVQHTALKSGRSRREITGCRGRFYGGLGLSYLVSTAPLSTNTASTPTTLRSHSCRPRQTGKGHHGGDIRELSSGDPAMQRVENCLALSSSSTQAPPREANNNTHRRSHVDEKVVIVWPAVAQGKTHRLGQRQHRDGHEPVREQTRTTA